MYESLFGITNPVAFKFTEVLADDWTLDNDHRWNNADYFYEDYINSPTYLINTKAKMLISAPSTYTEVMSLFDLKRRADYDPDDVVIVEPFLEDDVIYLIFYLLYSNYGNSTITSSDYHRWKQRLFSIIYQYAPIWIKKQEIQATLRKLTVSDIKSGAKTIMNLAENPQTAPTTDSNDELTYINRQSVMKGSKGTVDAYAMLYEAISTNVTQEFIDSFKPLFVQMTQPSVPLLY